MAEQQLNIYATYAYTDSYWALSDEDRKTFRSKLVEDACSLAAGTHFFSVFPCRVDADFMIWSGLVAEEPDVAANALIAYNRVAEGWRRYIKPVQVLWGFTRPSMYSRGKSEQDMDAFDEARCKFFIVYPFTKTKEWYMMSADARQGMMNEHIKIGKQYFDVKQLLLYSFGLQDQEFVVSYEVDNPVRFSELVNALRGVEGRRYTASDTPLVTGVYLKPEDFVR
jgi:chlorite dismutase